MKEFRCHWAKCPTAHNPSQVTFIEAPDEETARAILTDHVERHYGIGWFSISSILPYERPTGGRVIS